MENKLDAYEVTELSEKDLVKTEGGIFLLWLTLGFMFGDILFG